MATRKPAADRPRAQALAWLNRLSARERQALSLAATVLGLALVWWLAIAPAWATLRAAPARHAALDAQLSQMQALALTAERLRAASTSTPPGRDEVLRALETATAALGNNAQLSVLGDRATLALKGAPPQALAQWLAQVRINARLLPIESQLTRDSGTGGWSGSLVLTGAALGGNP